MQMISHGPAEFRQILASLRNKLLGQSAEFPVQYSSISLCGHKISTRQYVYWIPQTPDKLRQMILDPRRVSVGQLADTPVQRSSISVHDTRINKNKKKKCSIIIRNNSLRNTLHTTYTSRSSTNNIATCKSIKWTCGIATSTMLRNVFLRQLSLTLYFTTNIDTTTAISCTTNYSRVEKRIVRTKCRITGAILRNIL